ncbi:MAG: aldehyde dehydrogenase, partial [Porticoccaceae bacterium]|nr:aldehyde dehydrogenase [Porticoccaceae bacterium]
MSHWQNFIAGSWVDSSTSIEVENPATGEIFATVALASLADME